MGNNTLGPETTKIYNLSNVIIFLTEKTSSVRNTRNQEKYILQRSFLHKVTLNKKLFEKSRYSRFFMFQRWIPILKKYQVELPLECPFHESRDIFYPQQAAKFQHRTSQWTCGLCGKSFYAEKHLDAHFDSRHKSNVNMVKY